MVCLANLFYLRSILNLCSCSLSLLMSFLVIFFIIKKNLHKTYSYKILIYISINDFIRSSLGFFESLIFPNQLLCSLYGYVNFCFFASNVVWALCLTFTIFQIIVLEETDFEKFHKIWVFFAIFVVGGVEALPFITESYGFSNEICLMIDDETGKLWRFYIFYIPLSVIFGFIFILFVKIMRKVRIIGNFNIRAVVLDRGMIYTFIVLLAFIPFLAVRLVQMFGDSCLLESFTVGIIIFYNFQGFLNGVAFFCNKSIRTVIFQRANTLNSTVQSDLRSLRISFVSEFHP